VKTVCVTFLNNVGSCVGVIMKALRAVRNTLRIGANDVFGGVAFFG
jgi:hypothetical protein